MHRHITHRTCPYTDLPGGPLALRRQCARLGLQARERRRGAAAGQAVTHARQQGAHAQRLPGLQPGRVGRRAPDQRL